MWRQVRTLKTAHAVFSRFIGAYTVQQMGA